MTTVLKMSEQFLKTIAENNVIILNVMEAFQQGAEMLASTLVDLTPFFKVAGPFVKLALEHLGKDEAISIKKQFQKVCERLDVASEENKLINSVIKQSAMKMYLFPVEENITNLFRKYMDILNIDNPRDIMINLFMQHYDTTGGEKNLHSLYNAVIRSSGESVLEIMRDSVKKSRRAMEEFCAKLKNLFCMGIIVVMGYTALKGYDETEKLQYWKLNMEKVQLKMNTVIEDCITSFPEQAKEDVHSWFNKYSTTASSENIGKDLAEQDLADVILKELGKKYDWVRWSVRIFISPSSFFCKKEFQFIEGKSYFKEQAADMNIMVSYSDSPTPLNKAQIQKLIQEQKKIRITNTTKFIFNQLETCVVHIFQTKNLGHACNFHEDQLYLEEHNKNTFVCVHSNGGSQDNS
ncbi:uncharacterized protein LOC105006177 [Esox lucius]|uniref:Rapunzel 4 n=1 Tax=Esox lucius TaxID=8010 RepID=A0A3P8YX13_ESOLU|nr:uncharacterized protein LOC105006177 [Esox lucius]XP_010862865.1 uncharacterized protein LOC105006177 [Esox lucius]XP_010862868.1 uncharacterized protein LOC105006177 [Esox lucius]XP_010862870.1 uncharacterized protein LOC105006177 [Esox lucius]XP_019897691.1 uncharacterized protein LOC105006177 [Esox lucius]XP_034145492.1 uncharacterized protein LOC105006177 [Esox lucius]XP_034145493.1 uncharacterized protein LOC105006177 [Esox lucius]